MINPEGKSFPKLQTLLVKRHVKLMRVRVGLTWCVLMGFTCVGFICWFNSMIPDKLKTACWGSFFNSEEKRMEDGGRPN